MKIHESIASLQRELKEKAGAKVGFVPTMGALHSGHISLVSRAREECDIVVVSLFVNPTQFNDKSDLKHYPRTPAADAALLEAAGVDMLFLPSVEEIYPTTDERVFDFGEIDKVMEGATRAGHFNGVGQVVSRLFDIVRPTKAYFGEKDFQQIAVIHAMCKVLEIDVEIVECPIIRDQDGLALSSRNALLTTEHRAAAPEIYAALKRGLSLVGTLSPKELCCEVISKVDSNPLLKVIYFQAVDARTLQQVNSWAESESIQGCIAVQAGNIRLIDNIKLK
ncbi:MAG: pantoate--beta-alanine ligase [Rikenellaceae bacterium]